MASPMTFPLFPQFPPELRILIWEMSILDHNRDRLVPMKAYTFERIICVRNLACSPHFYATWESRKVAIDLYPIRLPISPVITVTPRESKEMALRVTEFMKVDCNSCPFQGAIYISTDHDIFALVGFIQPYYCIDRHYPDHNIFHSRCNWELRPASLSPRQLQSVRRIMLFCTIEPSSLKDGCHRQPHW